MKIKPVDQFSGANPASKMGRFLLHPIFRILIAFCFIVPVFIISKGIKSGLFPLLPQNYLIICRYIEAIFSFLLFLWFYKLYTQFIEKRKPLELQRKGLIRDIVTGFLISLLIVFLVVFVLKITHCFDITGVIGKKRLVMDLLVKFFMGAFIEELIFRLILFKITEELLGTWIALAIQALLFGFAHGLNDNATIFTSLAVAIVGGLVYTTAYIYSRSLWLPLGLHFGWNFAQSGICSMPNSGTPYEGLLVTKISGPEWLTGGAFGIEASYFTILLCLLLMVIFIIIAIKSSQIELPVWKRKNILL
jgi:CAAX protease family protein